MRIFILFSICFVIGACTKQDNAEHQGHGHDTDTSVVVSVDPKHSPDRSRADCSGLACTIDPKDILEKKNSVVVGGNNSVSVVVRGNSNATLERNNDVIVGGKKIAVVRPKVDVLRPDGGIVANDFWANGKNSQKNGIKPSDLFLNNDQIKALQPVYFVTDRLIKDTPLLQLSAITYDRSLNLRYGRAVVSVPKNHVIGKVERPKFNYFLWRYQPDADADDFRIKLLDDLARDQFVRELHDNDDSVFLFIHGYNVPFEDAVYKAAQIAYDANFGGSVIAFSWPSAGALLGYDYDRDSAEASSRDLLQLLRILNEEIGKKRIYIAAHSLGNLVLTGALQQAALSKVSIHISELVMAAPDVDTHLFETRKIDFNTITKNLTMYASSADKALLASNKKAWDTKMGYIGESGPNLMEGIETIDVTAVGDDMFGLNHSTFSTSRAVLDDLGHLIKSVTHLPPDQRTPTLKFMPDREHLKYWLYPR